MNITIWNFILQAQKRLLRAVSKRKGYNGDKIPIVDAKEVISTNEHPVMAIRKKKDSSLCKALSLVKEKKCDAVLSTKEALGFSWL